MVFRQTICREGLYYLLILSAVFAGALIKEVNLLLILAAMLLGPLFLNWRSVKTNLRGLRLERKLPMIISAGDQLTVGINLVNTRRRLGCWAVIVEEQIRRLPAGASKAKWATAAAVGESMVSLRAGRRVAKGRLQRPGCTNGGVMSSLPFVFPRGSPLGCSRARWSWATARR